MYINAFSNTKRRFVFWINYKFIVFLLEIVSIPVIHDEQYTLKKNVKYGFYRPIYCWSKKILAVLVMAWCFNCQSEHGFVVPLP